MIFSAPLPGGPLYHYYRSLVEALAAYPPLEGVALLPIDADSFTPHAPDDRSECNIGVYIPDNGLISPACMNPDFTWDLIVVPSHWLEFQLRIRGICNVVTILPGHDTVPSDLVAERLPDGRFIVASSGLMSLHQGHDLVLCAMRQFMQQHHDCCCVTDWILKHDNIQELRSSPYCSMERSEPWDLSELLLQNGIDPARCIPTNSSLTNESPWELVASADLYLAPSRVLLGDNATLSAFQAAGKPSITFEPKDCLPQLAPDGTTVWFEPAIENILVKLESAYTNWKTGTAVKCPVNTHPWATIAGEFYSILTKQFPIQSRPITTFTWNKRGVALAGLTLYDLAAESFHKALVIDLRNAETYNCLGNLMAQQERHQEALLYFEKAIAIDTNFGAAYFNKAGTLKDLKLYEDSIATYQKTIQLDPLFVRGWLNLAVVYALNEQEDKSDYCFTKTLEIAPDNTDALFLWGNRLLGQQQWENAIECYDRILSLDPEHYLACNSMGIAWLSLMEADKAYSVLHKALSIKPDLDSAMTNIGTACRDLDRLAEALMWYEKALAIDPDAADTHWNYALALLHTGNYQRGWQEYEWRFKKSDKINIRNSKLPPWDGKTDLAGKSILLQAEQGYGDTIQFLRYAPLLTARGAHVVIECQDANIQSVIPQLAATIDSINWSDTQPVTDFRYPLMSLPLALNSTLESLPAAEGYIFPPDDVVAQWESVVGCHIPKHSLRIGLVWDGRKTFRNDKRSIPLEKLIPLFEIAPYSFISIQKGEPATHLKSLPNQLTVHDFSEQLTTFADTAALISTLDLMICVDTSVAHLAGAVGCPTWIMLKTGPDWRWLENRNDSPWYSSVKLYRQQNDGDWDSVIQNIQHDLLNFIALKNKSKVSNPFSDNSK